eukprot:CAMPEP_0170518546 /NCGR_PEP_ID=MMETSP0209-20121228/4212_1 /TAXON_ID=665100 ORGANISM="Litonotus pictus, Strain P1" /NCGR_SAMPLE_ID=MMETSP0209 /ASSEMBLY_ACC=CAM_ASM_000301 /LENGTH=303 /DNA_ID=CAMNT_0010804147 /DNA_START=79 /DNA_END=990 /DNA_ORIENTATION=-
MVSKRKKSSESNGSQKSKGSKNSKTNKQEECLFEKSQFSLLENRGSLEKIVKFKNDSAKFFCLYQEVPIRIFDLNKEDFSFRSKNVPNDELDLKVPIWDTDVVQDRNSETVFYVSTGYGKIRTYDSRVKIQPISDQEEFNKVPVKKINKMVAVDDYLCIGDNTGRCCLLDKRKGKFCPCKTVVKAAGAITDINYLGDNFVATIAKDRFLRVFDMKTNEEFHKIYLKNQLSSMYVMEWSLEKNKEIGLEEEEEVSEEGEGSDGDLLDEEGEDGEDIADIDWDNIDDYEQSFDDDEEGKSKIKKA